MQYCIYAIQGVFIMLMWYKLFEMYLYYTRKSFCFLKIYF